ncbi:HAE1 family hydrophobic/amphiphilic exporter-1 [Pedobacter psychrotolerans]|uniref:HAE1 family hydrophobic/amphiphilic exporter-1 n=1 Tax=Pedobacter psychrotolerans TaxID=1843235 RepID=A0A4R2H9Z2_9SPHI|nr:efflux RND transporter permease subunit [Pedobacter psychrotolerans]TCO21611.1 HAE1 family hydrophobic/amphiphilic exporter-1 [Pedobacter psychrotolerans]GGE39898.1 multidrug ABC transporter [Pedobacter psychrotolerans]
MTITELSIKRPLLITVIFVTLILFGLISYNSLSLNLLPKFTTNMVSVNTTYTGASPEEVLTSVTKPLEDALSSVEGVDAISSSSQEGSSSISLELTNSVSTSDAQLDAERKVNQLLATLPQGVDDPVVSRMSSDDDPILKLSISSDMNDTELYDFIDNEIKPLLTNIPGVSDVTVIGGTKRQINVEIDNDKLKAYNLSLLDVNSVVSTSGASFPSGKIENDNNRYSLDLNAKVQTVAQLRDVVIRQNNDGSRVLLKDVASITDGKENVTQLNRLNSEPAIGIEIKKQTDANTVEVSKLAKQRLEELKKSYAADNFDYNIASDQSIYTQASADAVVHDLILAIIIVSFVMLFFLHSVRSSTFVLVALPSAMIPSFILMWIFGFSLNMMTLMALSLVVGVLVDDSIVILENIFRHMEMGKDKRTAALDGRNEIGFTALAITLVDVVVFLPLGFVGGMIGNIVKEYALVVVFSTLMSLFVAFTLTPLLASRWAKLPHLSKTTLWGKTNIWFESLIDQFREFYSNILKWSLSHKRYVIIAISVLIIGSMALIPAGFVGTEFIPTSDRGELNIQIDLAGNTPLKETNAKIAQIESVILKHPEVVNVFSKVGTQSGASMGSNASSNSNLAEISIQLTDVNERSISTVNFGRKVRDEIEQIPGVKPTIKTVGMTGNASFDIQMDVRGVNRDSIMKAAAIVKNIFEKTAGTDYVQYSSKEAKPQVSIVLNHDKMASYAVTTNDVGNAVQYGFSGNDNTKFRDDGEEYAINLQLDGFNTMTIEDVKKFNVKNSRGATIPLEAIATITETSSQSVLERKDRLNSVTVNAIAVGRASGSITDDINKELEKIKFPAGVDVVQAGFGKNQSDAFSSLFMAVGLGILLIYLIMVALYESIVYPFVVLFSLPVAIIGAILALALTLHTINLFSILGIIMLLGLVAKNAILIVDFTNQEKEKGKSVKDALIEAGRERLRPILMTTLAMILGMLPMALSSDAGSETKNGMAWVIIGGLTSSMIFTLVFVPVMYTIIEGWKNKVNGWFVKKNVQTARVQVKA